MFLRKVTIVVFKTFVIHCEQFTEDLAFYLLDKIINRIAINKATFFGIVSMQIKVKRKSILLAQMTCQFFYRINCRLMFGIRIDVESIEIFSVNIHTKMAIINSVNINHGYNQKNKHFSQQVSSEIIFIGEEVDYTLHGKRGRSLSRMYSGRNQNNRLVKPDWPFLFRKEELIKQIFMLIFLILMVIGCDSQ